MQSETDLGLQLGTSLVNLVGIIAGWPLQTIGIAATVGGAIGGLFGIKVERKRQRKSRQFGSIEQSEEQTDENIQ